MATPPRFGIRANLAPARLAMKGHGYLWSTGNHERRGNEKGGAERRRRFF